MHRFGTKDIEHDSGGTEYTNLNNSNGMEECRDRGRGNHCPRQPVMKGHDTIFCKAEYTKNIEHDNQSLVDIRWEDAGGDVWCKIQSTGKNIDENHGRKQESLRCCSQINNVFSSAIVSLFVLMMCDQGIGTDGDNLIKKIHGEKIVGESDSDGTEDCKSKTGIKAGLRMLFQAAHITHGIENSNCPERGRYNGKNHRH